MHSFMHSRTMSSTVMFECIVKLFAVLHRCTMRLFTVLHRCTMNLFTVLQKCIVKLTTILHRCIVKLTGEMMISFPAGIIRVLMDNPYPAPLAFRLKNLNNLDNILVNKQLVQE